VNLEDLAGLPGLVTVLISALQGCAKPSSHQAPLPLPLCCWCAMHCRLMSLLQQPSDEPVAVRLVAFAAALLPVILASGLA